MSLLVIPNVLVNGTGPANIVDAVGLNANFTAIATAVNNIYPSQILPITTAQATFGATATGVGYKFLANDATATPLTISGVTSQSAAIQSWTLTSGGTVALTVDKSGVLLFGDLSGVGPNGPWITGGASGALLLNTTGSQPITFSSGNTGSTTLGQFTSTGVFTVPNVISAGTLGNGISGTGYLSTSIAAAQGFLAFGSGAAWGDIDYGVTNGGFSLRANANAGYATCNGGTYTNSSDVSLKANIAPIASGTSEIMALQPKSFTWVATDVPGLGFIAQDVQGVLPDLVSKDNNGLMGVNYDGIIPVLVKAFQELNSEFVAYVAAHA